MSSKWIPTLQFNFGFVCLSEFLSLIAFWNSIAALVALTGLSNSAIIEPPAVWKILPENLKKLFPEPKEFDLSLLA